MSVSPEHTEIVGSESVEALAGHAVVQGDPATWWTPEHGREAKRAQLRVYLGAAPGVGKTYAMLSEAQRRMGRGTDVIAGYVQTYGRPKTAEVLQGLEVAPVQHLEYRGTTFEEMGTEADPEWLREIEGLTNDLGGTFAVVNADSPVDGILSFAYEQHVTQIVAGEPLRTRWQELMHGSFVNRLIRKAANIDIHVIARREQ
jgi:K+-sensing histidine kinase KdpD